MDKDQMALICKELRKVLESSEPELSSLLTGHIQHIADATYLHRRTASYYLRGQWGDSPASHQKAIAVMHEVLLIEAKLLGITQSIRHILESFETKHNSSLLNQ